MQSRSSRLHGHFLRMRILFILATVRFVALFVALGPYVLYISSYGNVQCGPMRSADCVSYSSHGVPLPTTSCSHRRKNYAAFTDFFFAGVSRRSSSFRHTYFHTLISMCICGVPHGPEGCALVPQHQISLIRGRFSRTRQQ